MWNKIKRIVSRGFGKISAIVFFLIATLIFFSVYWSNEPAQLSPLELAGDAEDAGENSGFIGSASIAALINVAETLLTKPGGFLSNDIMPPGVYLDNIPNWEFGVLVQVRDFSRAFREGFSRSQSQSTEDIDLIVAEPLFNFTTDSWIFPASESEYRKAILSLKSYQGRLADIDNAEAQFYARADNLSSWFSNVESRLGSLSQRLSMSAVQPTDDVAAVSRGGLEIEQDALVKTAWLEIDNVFFEARGATWALLHFLQAVQVDFADVIDDKNAGPSLRQVVRELESSQEALVFPVVLNGGGYGLFANHSLTIANYISRANAAIIELRNLLSQG
ncbi:MAG: hypothetical protein CL926_10805 [Deltaproteobacteria bacterium]|jgi:hypothetical protein|nr:hypothetical protein [Deltaproteobacteria bacterium]|tara:strand:+ start:1205 stop:2203 length:999 start_codon:yes stop_codon:yes gene_type:complete